MFSYPTKSLASFVVLLAVVAAGLTTGMAIDRSGGASIVGLSVFAGLGCLFGGCWQRVSDGQSVLLGPIACVALVVYVIVIAAVNPLELVISEGEVARSLLLLAPLALGAAVFRRQGRWIGALGGLLVFYGFVVAVSFNVFNRSYGIGVFSSRME